jgi:HSP20 family protein
MFGLMPRRREHRVPYGLARGEKTPLEFLRREFASLFDRAFAGWPVPFESFGMMPEGWGLEMEEKEEEVIVRAEVPGFEANELDVRLAGDLLTIRAEHKAEPKKGGEEPVEERYGKMERTLTLPPGIVPEKVEARYHNGVLEVHVPRSPAVMPKRIEVKT